MARAANTKTGVYVQPVAYPTKVSIGVKPQPNVNQARPRS